MRHGATGVRCEECLQLSPRARGLATRRQIIHAALAASATGVAAGILVGWLAWVNLISGLALGFVVGSAAFLASRRHRDAAVQGIAGAAALAAMLLATVIASLGGMSGDAGGLLRVAVNIPYASFLLPSLAAIAGAVLRFLI